MQWTAVKSNWAAFLEPILERWPNTTEEDLIEIDGDRDRLAAYLADRHELTAPEADEQISTWLEGAVPADVAMDETRDDDNIHASAAHIGTGEDVYADDKDFGDQQISERPLGRDG